MNNNFDIELNNLEPLAKIIKKNTSLKSICLVLNNFNGSESNELENLKNALKTNKTIEDFKIFMYQGYYGLHDLSTYEGYPGGPNSEEPTRILQMYKEGQEPPAMEVQAHNLRGPERKKIQWYDLEKDKPGVEITYRLK